MKQLPSYMYMIFLFYDKTEMVNDYARTGMYYADIRNDLVYVRTTVRVSRPT